MSLESGGEKNAVSLGKYERRSENVGGEGEMVQWGSVVWPRVCARESFEAEDTARVLRIFTPFRGPLQGRFPIR